MTQQFPFGAGFRIAQSKNKTFRRKVLSISIDILLCFIIIPMAIYAGVKEAMTKKAIREGRIKRI